MQQFGDKVAVITGAASGIGRALADQCAAEGMKVVLADVEIEALSRAANEIETTGAAVLAVPTDVSRADQVAALAQKTMDTFGRVDLLCNNAGVGAGSTIWGSTLADWEWVMGVNLWGVIHGVRSFVPLMLAQDSEGHIVNTASITGLLPYHPVAPYQVTKHAVVGLTEHLDFSFRQSGAKLRASVLCPGWVQSQIMDSYRNRPPALQNPPERETLTPQIEAAVAHMRQELAKGLPAARVAGMVFEVIRRQQLYILTHPDMNQFIRQRFDAVLPPEQSPTA